MYPLLAEKLVFIFNWNNQNLLPLKLLTFSYFIFFLLNFASGRIVIPSRLQYHIEKIISDYALEENSDPSMTNIRIIFDKG